MTNTKETLKPCPFCGGEAEEIWGFSGVWCKVCDARINHPKREKAIAAWNTRVAADELAGALQELLSDIIEFQTINNLGGENNHAQLRAKTALKKAGIKME